MADRAAKLRRLNEFRRSLPHVSASALSSILDEVNRIGVPDMYGRKHMQQATALELHGETPYGPLFQTAQLHNTSGGLSPMVFINPFAMLHKAATCPGFASLLENQFRQDDCSPEHPWRIILYTDEVVPGNQLSIDNLRKMWVAYWSFMELGPAALSQENAWFCMLAMRSSDVAKVAAGISQVVGQLIKVFFGFSVHDFSTGGIMVQTSSGTRCRVFAKLGMILQDGGAHKAMWHCKGDAGTKLCMLCLNLYSSKSQIVDEDGEDMLTCSLVHEHELHFATDEDVRGAVRRLAAFKVTDPPRTFEQRQQAIGFKHEPHGLLMDLALDNIVQPVSQLCHDWMHAVFVHGVFGTVTFRLMEALTSAGKRDIWDRLNEYVALWTWPSRLHNSGFKDMFSAKRIASCKRAKFFKCTASEGLSIYTVLTFFVQTVIMHSGTCVPECKAFIALADLIDILSLIPLGCVRPDQLRSVVKVFLELCLDAGWKVFMHPKFHWMVHMPKHLAQFGCLPTCWVHERKHRMVKRYATEICNTVSFERSVLGEVISHHLSELAHEDAFPKEGLVRPRYATHRLQSFLASSFHLPEGERCSFSHTARFSQHESCSKGDVVLFKDEATGAILAGQIWFHTVVYEVGLTVLTTWERSNWDTVSGAAEWLVRKAPIFVKTSDIRASVAHCECRPGVCRTLVPCILRVDM